MHFTTLHSLHHANPPQRRAWRIWAPLLVLLACWTLLRHPRQWALT